MKFILDTNICVYIIKQKPAKVFEKFKELPLGSVGISSITLAELQYGVRKSSHPEKNQLALNQFLIPRHGGLWRSLILTRMRQMSTVSSERI